MTNHKIIKQALLFGSVFCIAFFGTKYFLKNLNSGGDDTMKKASDEINKTCPLMIDKETRLDSTEFLDSLHIFEYHYTLINVVRNDSTFNVKEVKQRLIQQSQKNLNQNASMKYQRENNIGLKYSYKDKNGNPFFDFSIKNLK